MTGVGGRHVLVANRGEIALRLVRAVQELGWYAVAVFARDEADAAHVRAADEAHQLSGEGVGAYLAGAELIEVAGRAGCALVAPGYGFLSESAAFARACEDAGLVFAGPTPHQLERLGDKVRARELAQECGIPVLAATEPDPSADRARAFHDQHRSVMVKALSGGGGRGMRPVGEDDDLGAAMTRAASEAERAFGDGRVYLEELLTGARHVEVQVVGDGAGGVVHLGERECTLQRRGQKLVEMAPSPWLPQPVRERLLDDALRLARRVGYRGLGTVEFLVAGDRHVFIEANPRLQVEHTVTEEVWGVDLVEILLRVAAGARLADLGLEGRHAPRGLALQSRVNAERLDAAGAPEATHGTVHELQAPLGAGVRVDTALRVGTVVTGTYDSLLAKVVVQVSTMEVTAALAKAHRALGDLVIAGVETNTLLLQAILSHPEVRAGQVDTTWVDRHQGELVPHDSAPAADPGARGAVLARSSGVVVEMSVAPGDRVARGQQVAVLEAMKMEHVLAAPAAGTVLAVHAGVGDAVRAEATLVELEVAADDAETGADAVEQDLDEIRADLNSLRDRRARTLDDARPEAMTKRHGLGLRSARENVADLVDEGSFVEYGAFAVAAQRRRRSEEELIAATPADGIITGIGTVNADVHGAERTRCAVLAYDYTVLAGTQGYLNHKKTDRLLGIAQEHQLPVVLFAEGGGGRPGDTDPVVVSGLDVPTFATMGRLSGQVPTVGIVTGRCFAGNAALLGCCDVVIAAGEATIGMGGPAMIEGGGLGSYRPEEVGPLSVQVPNGVVDVAVADEAEAVDVARRFLAYTQGPLADWQEHDQRRLRFVVPQNRVRAYRIREVVELVADVDSVLELRAGFGRGIVTALVRIEGRPMGLVANNPEHLGGAIDADAADKYARFLQLCDSYGLPVVSLCDTPGFMVGPEAERTATVRHFARLFVIGSHLSVPLATVVLRKGYGLGAQAMAGGAFVANAATIAWPTGEVGAMGLEGAVRLGFRRELEQAAHEGGAQAQQALFEKLLARSYERGRAVNAAAYAELDDVIDPVETRRWLTTVLGAVTPGRERRPYIDTW